MNKPDKLLINNKLTIKECFNKLNKTQEKLLIVTNKSKNFIGVINDGDIRRALLNGANLRDPIDKFVNKKSLFTYDTTNKSQALQLLTSKKKCNTYCKY